MCFVCICIRIYLYPGLYGLTLIITFFKSGDTAFLFGILKLMPETHERILRFDDLAVFQSERIRTVFLTMRTFA